ncbi:MAG: glycosyltransferase family 4 protein [Planctomyces sp.]|nr:glycosyltransferase family 4 protein [Planctomyces sp.]
MVLHTRVVTGTGGGPEKTILNSPRYLRKYGFDSACLFMRPPGDEGFAVLEKKAAAADAEILGLDDRGPFDWNVVRQCIRACREREVNIWHAHDYKSNALGLLVQKFHPMHLVTTAHGWVRFTSKTPLYYRIDRFCMKRYREVICVSQDLVEACRKTGVAAERLQLIDNAIVLDDYSTQPPTLKDRMKFGFDSGITVIGAAGRLSEEKGFHHLIDAVARLIRDGHQVGLVIAGEGHLREQLQQQIDLHEMQSHIRLAGFLSDPRDLYRAVDLFVLSSIREGLPNVVLEAMASQRPVVVTACNGIPRLVENDRNGVVVRPDSVESLYNGIQKCLSSSSFCRSIAAEGRTTIEEQFCFDRRMQKVIRVYGKLSDQLRAYTERRLNDVTHESGDSNPMAAQPVDTKLAVSV